MIDLTRRQKQAVAVAILCGAGAYSARNLRNDLRKAQREQLSLCGELDHNKGRRKPTKVAVDQLFGKRLLRILKICVPNVFSYETGLISVQAALLVTRTLLTDLISRLEAKAGSHLIAQDFGTFARLTGLFTVVSLPAAIVNSGLKYMQKLIKIAFMKRLTVRLHNLYCDNRAYYAASTLGGLQQADQRITEDIEKFCFSISELYSYTFKPLLDVILFTRSLSRIMGYKSQFALYGYFLAASTTLRALSPPLALMTAQETALSGALRNAHQRLVAHSEEVAYNDPPGGLAEQLILNDHVRRLLRHSSLSAFQQFIQQVFDGYLVKYLASTVALFVYAAPLYFKPPSRRGNQTRLTQDYIRAMRLLQNTSRGIGDLILVYKRVTALAGHTSRVAELLEQVKLLARHDEGHFHRQLFMRNVSSGTVEDMQQDGKPLPQPVRLHGDHIKFNRVYLTSPDGTPLVRQLTFEVVPGRSVLVMGPNGSGKSSLFRVLAGLWPLQAGEVTLPHKSDVFFLSQRPYLVTGSLRDQLLYPLPPFKFWSRLDSKESAQFDAWMKPEYQDVDMLEERMCQCLEAVELDYLLGRGDGWNQVQNWSETLSGGEKQRLAMARLLFHHPKFAVLDECTSAVSADGEVKLYQTCVAAGITLFSIAHRPALRQFHKLIIHFDGTHVGQGWHIEDISDGCTDSPPTLTNETLRASVSVLINDGLGSPSEPSESHSD